MLKPNFTAMATGAEELFVQHLSGYLWLTWELHLRVMVPELFKFTVGEMYRLFSSAFSYVYLPEVITQRAAVAAQEMCLLVAHSPLSWQKHCQFHAVVAGLWCTTMKASDDGDVCAPILCLVPAPALVMGTSLSFLSASARGHELESWSFGLSLLWQTCTGGTCASVIVIKGKCRVSVVFKVREVLSQEDKQKNYQEGKITTLNYNPISSHQIPMTCCPLKDIYTSHHFSSLIKFRYKKLSIMKCDFSCQLHAYKKDPAFRVNFNDMDSL